MSKQGSVSQSCLAGRLTCNCRQAALSNLCEEQGQKVRQVFFRCKFVMCFSKAASLMHKSFREGFLFFHQAKMCVRNSSFNVCQFVVGTFKANFFVLVIFNSPSLSSQGFYLLLSCYVSCSAFSKSWEEGHFLPHSGLWEKKGAGRSMSITALGNAYCIWKG